jgi:monoamine oxidase
MAIGQNDNSAWVVVEHAGRRETLLGEHVVCALPFSMARMMFAEARLSAQKQQVIREQKYFPVEKVFLQMKEQYWKKYGLSGFATSDLISERFWSIANCGPDNRGLLLSYLVGENAQRLDQKVEADRLELTLADAETIFPGATKHYEGGRSKSWAQDPWQSGGLAQFDPGQIGFIPISARPEGRIHFAGEHTSRWTGWMQGALESAQRVVQEITG